MRTVLFTGLKGSGKSTAILSLACYLKKRGGPSPVAVVEAESGELDVCSKLSHDKAFHTADLTRGCVGCTSLTSGLSNALDILHSAIHPAWLLIESSAIGFQTIKDIVVQSAPGTAQPYTVLLIEAGGWAELCQGSPLLADGLVRGADLALVNIFETLPPDTLSTLTRNFSSVNPDCAVKAVRVPDSDPADLYASSLESGQDTEAGPVGQVAAGMADERASVPHCNA
jgi:G3E family GTPase